MCCASRYVLVWIISSCHTTHICSLSLPLSFSLFLFHQLLQHFSLSLLCIQLMSLAAQQYLKDMLHALKIVAWQRNGGLNADLLSGTLYSPRTYEDCIFLGVFSLAFHTLYYNRCFFSSFSFQEQKRTTGEPTGSTNKRWFQQGASLRSEMSCLSATLPCALTHSVDAFQFDYLTRPVTSIGRTGNNFLFSSHIFNTLSFLWTSPWSLKGDSLIFLAVLYTPCI